ncbi:MAG: transglycosylase SLT domain-containing protein [Bacteroidota bacterium]
MNFHFLILLTLLSISLSCTGQTNKSFEEEKIEVKKGSDQSVLMDADQLFGDRWNSLPQPLFWKEIMTLSPDSCLVNVAASRQILVRMAWKDWAKQTEIQKTLFKDSLKVANGIASTEAIYVTTGKNDFYKFKDVYPQLSKGVAAFEKYGVDPWYAQAILLIESPGQLKKSTVGAYGAFQLMPSVARSHGLKVDKYIDERANFDRCAYGAACVLSKVCIPEAKRILNAKNIAFQENELWFRLFVLHVYHAGSMNVRAVVDKINPTAGSQDLIKQMWQNSAAGFGNNSQNYTQLALASQLILHDIVYSQCDEIFECYPN